MKYVYSRLIMAGIVLFTAFSLNAQTTDIATSYFSKSVIKSILNQRGCAGIRMYPVVDAKNVVTVMIIGIDDNGKEIYNSNSPSSYYQIFTEVVGEKVVNKALKKEEAKSGCSAYSTKNVAFVSDIDRKTIEKLFMRKSAGIVVQYVAVESGNFVVRAYEEDNGPKAFGESKPGDPCPSACGQSEMYLCPPNKTR